MITDKAMNMNRNERVAAGLTENGVPIWRGRVTLKALELNGSNRHPDIKTSKQYMVRIDGHWSAGSFSEQHYGWNFDDWGASGCQLNLLEAVFEISEVKALET